MSELDINIGDIVQVRPNATNHAGRIGKVICIQPNKTHFDLTMVVKFTDTESVNFFPNELLLVRASRPSSSRQEVKYETR